MGQLSLDAGTGVHACSGTSSSVPDAWPVVDTGRAVVYGFLQFRARMLAAPGSRSRTCRPIGR